MGGGCMNARGIRAHTQVRPDVFALSMCLPPAFRKSGGRMNVLGSFTFDDALKKAAAAHAVLFFFQGRSLDVLCYLYYH
jgi:hypothetical protein